MTLAQVRVIGMLHMIDEDEDDTKIIAVYDTDPRFKDFKSMKEVPDHIQKELKHFFTTYKELQGKHTKVLEVMDKDEAIKAVERGSKLYAEKYQK